VCQTLDGAQTPGDARREERVHERKSVRQHCPPAAGRAREPVLNPRHELDRHEGIGVREEDADRWITLE